MIGRLFIYLAIFVCSVAVTLTLFYTPAEISDLVNVYIYLPLISIYTQWAGKASDSTIKNQKNTPEKVVKDSKRNVERPKLFTEDELKQYNGEAGSKGLYLAILGHVYDVQNGKQHYGPAGGYHFFTGKDGTRGFVSGDFTDKGLIPDVSGLSHQDMLGLDDWQTFYDKDYTYVGKVVGHYFNSDGSPTENWINAQKALKEAKAWKLQQEDENKRHPPCNSEWSQDKGGRVWCSNKSGGIDRSWVGVPRKLYKPGSKDYRCACIRNTGPPSTGDLNDDSNKGDLNLANLLEYEDCDPTSSSCKIS